jgi:pilus assembly protein CpaD
MHHAALEPKAAGWRLIVLSAPLVAILFTPACSAISEGARDLGLPIENQGDVLPIPEPLLATQQYRHDVRFALGEAALSPGERDRLEHFLATLPAPAGEAVVLVPAAEAPALMEQRLGVVGGVLAAAGRPWRRGRFAAADDGLPFGYGVAAVIDVTVVRLPPCPDWSGWPNDTFSNSVTRNFGCATAVNFGLQIANPEDLGRGREPGLADGAVMSRSIERYRAGKTKELIREAASSDSFPTSGGK